MAPTATTAKTIEKTCAPWLCVVQSLLLFVVQSLEFFGEFCVELSESFDESCELCDDSPDECDESFEPFEEFESFEDESPELDPELLCPEAQVRDSPCVPISAASATATAILAGRRGREGRMKPPSSTGPDFYSREQRAEITGEIRYPKETSRPRRRAPELGCALPCTCAIDTLPSRRFVAMVYEAERFRAHSSAGRAADF